jgi:serine/threonine protein kinase
MGNSAGTVAQFEQTYCIGEVLGSGASSVVRRVKHKRDGTVWAAKLVDLRPWKIRKTFKADYARLASESKILKSLRHDNIVKLEETFEDRDTVVLILEFVPGMELFQSVVAKKKYSEEAGRQVFRQLCSALAYIHEQNIVHRDIKLENIMIVPAANAKGCPRVKLVDFGLSAQVGGADCRTFVGTPGYFAPEVNPNHRLGGPSTGYGIGADCWSLGVVLHVMLTGMYPEFVRQNHKILRLNNGPMEKARLSAEAVHLCRRLMTVEVSARFSVQGAAHHKWTKHVEKISTFQSIFQFGEPVASKPQQTASTKAGGSNRCRQNNNGNENMLNGVVQGHTAAIHRSNKITHMTVSMGKLSMKMGCSSSCTVAALVQHALSLYEERTKQVTLPRMINLMLKQASPGYIVPTGRRYYEVTFERGPIGLELQSVGNVVCVKGFKKKDCAARVCGKIQKADVLISVNGHEVLNMPFEVLIRFYTNAVSRGKHTLCFRTKECDGAAGKSRLESRPFSSIGNFFLESFNVAANAASAKNGDSEGAGRLCRDAAALERHNSMTDLRVMLKKQIFDKQQALVGGLASPGGQARRRGTRQILGKHRSSADGLDVGEKSSEVMGRTIFSVDYGALYNATRGRPLDICSSNGICTCVSPGDVIEIPLREPDYTAHILSAGVINAAEHQQIMQNSFEDIASYESSLRRKIVDFYAQNNASKKDSTQIELALRLGDEETIFKRLHKRYDSLVVKASICGSHFSNGALYYHIKIEFPDAGATFRSFRRFSEFFEFNSKLQRRYERAGEQHVVQHVCSSMPSKGGFIQANFYDEAHNNERWDGLTSYLRRIVFNQRLVRDHAVWSFLAIDPNEEQLPKDAKDFLGRVAAGTPTGPSGCRRGA